MLEMTMIISTLRPVTLALAVLVASAAPVWAEPSPETSARCVQEGLNALGFNAGTADGILGSGTKTAFDNYKASQTGLIDKYPLADFTIVPICLYLSREAAANGKKVALADAVAREAEAFFIININPDAAFSLSLLRRDGTQIPSQGKVEPFKFNGKDVRLWRTSYAEVAGAEQFCLLPARGWVIQDESGKKYGVGCQQFDPVLFTGLGFVASWNVVAGEPDAQ